MLDEAGLEFQSRDRGGATSDKDVQETVAAKFLDSKLCPVRSRTHGAGIERGRQE